MPIIVAAIAAFSGIIVAFITRGQPFKNKENLFANTAHELTKAYKEALNTIVADYVRVSEEKAVLAKSEMWLRDFILLHADGDCRERFLEYEKLSSPSDKPNGG